MTRPHGPLDKRLATAGRRRPDGRSRRRSCRLGVEADDVVVGIARAVAGPDGFADHEPCARRRRARGAPRWPGLGGRKRPRKRRFGYSVAARSRTVVTTPRPKPAVPRAACALRQARAAGAAIEGDGHERDEAPLAVGGKPSTFWRTERYARFFKSGSVSCSTPDDESGQVSSTAPRRGFARGSGSEPPRRAVHPGLGVEDVTARTPVTKRRAGTSSSGSRRCLRRARAGVEVRVRAT
jgi:hypothetical protein